MAEIEIRFAELSQLDLAEGDTLLLRVPASLEDEIEHLTEQLRACFPGHPIVVLANDVELEVVRPAPAGPAEGQLAEVDGVHKRYVGGDWIEA
jgi:hypothetical protein